MVTWKVSEEGAELVLRALQSRIAKTGGEVGREYKRLLDDFEHTLKVDIKGDEAPIECFVDTNQTGSADNLMFETTFRINHTCVMHIPLGDVPNAYEAELLGVEKMVETLECLLMADLLPKQATDLVIYNDCKSLVHQLSGRGKVKTKSYSERVLNLRYKLEELALQNGLRLHFDWMRRNRLNQRLGLPN